MEISFDMLDVGENGIFIAPIKIFNLREERSDYFIMIDDYASPNGFIIRYDNNLNPISYINVPDKDNKAVNTMPSSPDWNLYYKSYWEICKMIVQSNIQKIDDKQSILLCDFNDELSEQGVINILGNKFYFKPMKNENYPNLYDVIIEYKDDSRTLKRVDFRDPKGAISELINTMINLYKYHTANPLDEERYVDVVNPSNYKLVVSVTNVSSINHTLNPRDKKTIIIPQDMKKVILEVTDPNYKSS